MILLGLCAAQYFTVKEKELDVHFFNASVLLMAALLAVLVVLLRRSFEEESGLLALASGGTLPEALGGATPPVFAESSESEPSATAKADEPEGPAKEEAVTETTEASSEPPSDKTS
jgi:hypothetical protein